MTLPMACWNGLFVTLTTLQTESDRHRISMATYLPKGLVGERKSTSSEEEILVQDGP